LNTYSDELITYVPVGGGSATQPRYRIDGPVNTGDNCLANLQQLADSCDSWLQYSELTGKWTIVMNKPYSGVLGDLYSVDSSVLIGGIDINPLDLNQTYNSLEVQYPNANINDQTDYKVVDLTTSGTAWYDPSLLSPNEPNNRLVVQYPQINNYVRAVYLGVRRLLQSREDLTINCNLDYSGIQVVAGDVVRVTLAEYGWTDKLFRVSQVQETKTTEGFLGARIVAFEYNATVYADNALDDFIPEANTGLKDPNIFDQPTAPVVTLAPVANGAINYYSVSSNVPAVGTTLYMDFNIGNSSNVQTHKSYSSVQVGDGTPYTAGTTITINVADSSPGTYYWSSTARNDFAGRQSNSSAAFVWAGPSVTTFDSTSNTGGVRFNQISNEVVSALIPAGGYSYKIDNFPGTPLLPVDTATSPPVTAPQYINGTTQTTKIYPYFQGTSSTADGYFANSTAPWLPGDASAFLWSTGINGWYIIHAFTFFTPLTTSEVVETQLDSQFVADANTTLQIVPWIYFPSTGYYVDTQYIMSIDLPANTPYIWQDTRRYAGTASISAIGYLWRNIVSGTQVTSAQAALQLFYGKTL
jgi:hypothetical protein